MDLRNQEAYLKIEIAVETIKSRMGIEGVSIIHQNGSYIKSIIPELPNDQLEEFMSLSSFIFSIGNQIQDKNWEFIILESRLGIIVIIPLFFDDRNEVCPFFLQLHTQPNVNLKNLLLNIQNPITIIIKELSSINWEKSFSNNKTKMELDTSLSFERENPEISAILANYFGFYGKNSLDIESVVVYIRDRFYNSIGLDKSGKVAINMTELIFLNSILSNSEKLFHSLKNDGVSSIRIDYSNHFHFIFPIVTSKMQSQAGFLSIITKSHTKLGLWLLLIPQVIHTINLRL